MRDDKFLAEIISRLQGSSSDGVVSSNRDGFVTDSETTCEAVLCFMELLGLDQYVSITDKMQGSAVEHHITFDLVESRPEWLKTEGKQYHVSFMCGEFECERHGYNDVVEACTAAVSFNSEAKCDLASVFRLNDQGVYDELFWCSFSGESKNFLADDDPDYQVVKEAIESIKEYF